MEDEPWQESPQTLRAREMDAKVGAGNGEQGYRGQHTTGTWEGAGVGATEAPQQTRGAPCSQCNVATFQAAVRIRTGHGGPHGRPMWRPGHPDERGAIAAMCQGSINNSHAPSL